LMACRYSLLVLLTTPFQVHELKALKLMAQW